MFRLIWLNTDYVDGNLVCSTPITSNVSRNIDEEESYDDRSEMGLLMV